MTFRLVGGDCIEAMQAMAENSVDAIVTDPPYGLEFMGKEWDRLWDSRAGDPELHPNGKAWAEENGRASGNKGYAGLTASPNYRGGIMAQEWHHAWATEALRILKPGGHVLAFGGTRTYHRLACAIEDAGFEIRDCIAWMYGSGFPKSLDVSKAIDKAAPCEVHGITRCTICGPVQREVVGAYSMPLDSTAPGYDPGNRMVGWDTNAAAGDGPSRPITAPATPEAQRWNGWGTALKPAFEPIVLARKPLSERNVAANVQRWGTGALNIDGCRIDFDGAADEAEAKGKNQHADFGSGEVVGYHGWDSRAEGGNYNPPGRWPANVTLDETAAAMLDEQTGELTTPATYKRNAQVANQVYGQYGSPETMQGYGDTGGASRFFYCPKADREERNRGLEHMAEQPRSVSVVQAPGRADFGERDENGKQSRPAKNHHPTVKPVELMRWLCRMVTPKGGTVLDPFTGSGSTGVAAMREGFEFIGIEREAEYVEIARARIIGDAPLFNVEAEPQEWNAPLADRIAEVAIERGGPTE